MDAELDSLDHTALALVLKILHTTDNADGATTYSQLRPELRDVIKALGSTEKKLRAFLAALLKSK